VHHALRPRELTIDLPTDACFSVAILCVVKKLLTDIASMVTSPTHVAVNETCLPRDNIFVYALCHIEFETSDVTPMYFTGAWESERLRCLVAILRHDAVAEAALGE